MDGMPSLLRLHALLTPTHENAQMAAHAPGSDSSPKSRGSSHSVSPCDCGVWHDAGCDCWVVKGYKALYRGGLSKVQPPFTFHVGRTYTKPPEDDIAMGLLGFSLLPGARPDVPLLSFL